MSAWAVREMNLWGVDSLRLRIGVLRCKGRKGMMEKGRGCSFVYGDERVVKMTSE